MVETDAEAIKYTSEADYALKFFLAKWQDYNNPTVNDINRKGRESYKNLLSPQELISWLDITAIFLHSKLSLCAVFQCTFLNPPFMLSLMTFPSKVY